MRVFGTIGIWAWIVALIVACPLFWEHKPIAPPIWILCLLLIATVVVGGVLVTRMMWEK